MVFVLAVPPATLPASAGYLRPASERNETAAVLPPVVQPVSVTASPTSTTFDNFNRTTSSPYWGSGPTSGIWSTFIPTFCTGYTASVDGSAGTMTGSLGASCSGSGRADQSPNPSPNLRFWDAPSWQFTGQVKTSAIDNSELKFAVATQVNQYLIAGIRLSFRPTDGVVAIERGPYTEPASFSWQANTWYTVKWVVAWSNQARVKVWLTGQNEPSDWLITEAVAPHMVPDSPFVVWWRAPYGPTKVSVDDFAFGPAPILPKLAPPPGTEHNPPYTNQEETGDPVSSYTGSMSDSHVDIAIPGRGPAIEFARSYNSNDTRATTLGPGWTHSYNIQLVDPNDGSADVILVGPGGRSDRYVWTGSAFNPPIGVHRTLVRNADQSYTARDKSQTAWTFDPSGRLDQIIDRYGNASTMTYNIAGLLTGISDPAGRGSLSLAYTNGLLTSVTDWASPTRSVAYQYDANGRLWKITDREGKTTTLTYDGTSQRLATITDARGNVSLTTTYDAQGRVATQKDARGLITGDVTTFDYVVNPDTTRVTTITAPTTSYEPAFHPTLVDSYDANGWLSQRVTRPTSSDTLTQLFTYDSAGNQTSITDPRGNRTDFCFDVDYAGVTIAGAAANLTRRVDPAPTPGANRPVTLWQYDIANNVTQTVPPKGVPSGASVTCTTNLSATNTTYAADFGYDAARVYLVSQTSRFTDPDTGLKTAITKFEYGDALNPGLVTRVIPPRGNTGPSPDYTYARTTTYFTSGTKAGMLKDVTDALGNVTSYDYDAVGRLISSVDPLGGPLVGPAIYHTTSFTYDKEDRLRFVSAPAPASGGAALVTETRYDDVGNPIVRIDAKGQVTTYSFDERNSLFQVKESPLAWTDPASPPATLFATEYTRDAGSNPTRITRAKGDAAYERPLDYVYDGRGLPRTETQYPAWPSTSGALTTTFGYDGAGNQTAVIDPLGQSLTVDYDALNQKTAMDYSDPLTPDVSYAYDTNGNRTQMVDGTGTTSYVLDEANRPTSVTTPGPTIVGYRYDLDGNRTKLIYPDATAVTYTFNKGGQLGSLADWAARTVAYTYWPDGLVKTATNPDATVASFNYDNTRRLFDISHTRSNGQLFDRSFYTLDAVGNVTSLNNGLLPTQFERPDGFASSNGTWTGTFASIDEVVPSDSDFIASPSGPAAPNYYEVSLSDVQAPMDLTAIKLRYRMAKSGNDGGQTVAMTVQLRQGSTVIYSHSYQGLSGVTGAGWTTYTDTLLYPVASSITNFSDLRIRFIPTSSGSGQARKAQISWAELEVPSAPDPAAATTYGYDRLSRLTAATDSAGGRSYTYDPVGNRLTKVDGGTTTYIYDRADRMTAAGAVSVTVDASGNLVAKGSDTFGFDQANRLRTATVAGATETYLYDGDGRRFSRQVGTNPAIRYTSDLSGDLATTLADGSRKYVYGVGLAYAVMGSAAEIYHTDRLGSVRALTDATAAVTATYRVDEWGRSVATTGSSSQPYTYTGEPRDATGLTYLRTRYFDPDVGRFLSRDTWPGAPGAPQTQDRYAYVGNNPVSATDPTGRIIDTLLDAAFIVYDVTSLIFGPAKERGANWLALGADVGSAFVPFVTGGGLAARGAVKIADHADDAIGPIRYLDDAAQAACSFTAETLVATPDGSVPISAIEVGDIVVAWDETTGQLVERTVTAVLPHPDDEIAQLKLSNGTVVTTPDHPFFTIESGWVEAGRLWLGAHVRTTSGTSVVRSVALRPYAGLLWDLTVDGAHTFFVGEGAWLVHNCTIDPRQLRSKYKHAEDFGISGPWNADNAAAYEQAIRSAVSANPGVSGTLRGQIGTWHLDPETGLAVFVDQGGNYVSGWSLSADQLIHFPNIGGG